MIDTHAHMNEIEEIDKSIQRAADAGIDRIIAVGMDIESNKKTLSLANQFPGIIHPAIGYHPWSISPGDIDDNLAFIEDNLDSCIALGEVGLDYKSRIKKKIQWDVFSRILSIAKKWDRPVIVHSRFSHKRTHQMVKEANIKKAVFHWYSGPIDTLQQIIEDGYYISATPALAYSPQHKAAVECTPLEQILVETDAPAAYQGNVSEPADLLITLREISRLKGIEPEATNRITTTNAERFFNIQRKGNML